MPKEIKMCKKCVMLNTRPGISFDEHGVCEACNNYAKKDKINWDKRLEELEKLCSKYRGCNGDGYDCAIAVSGGKDSTIQIYIMKEIMKMNPLLISVDNWTWTETGRKNKENISEAFGCDIISFSQNRKAGKRMMLKGLEKLGAPAWFIDSAIYSFPVKMCMKMGLQLLVYGENVNYEYGGNQKEETYSANQQFKNGVIKPINYEEWIDDAVSMRDFKAVEPPTLDMVEAAGLESIYLSYFIKWDTHYNYQLAQLHGFMNAEHEWQREGNIENYNQIDSMGYLVNQWIKYPKFGNAGTTDMAARYVRAGLMTRAEALKLVKERDYKLDQKMLEDFCQFVGITKKRFWEIADQWYNQDLFEKDRFGVWKKKQFFEDFYKVD